MKKIFLVLGLLVSLSVGAVDVKTYIPPQAFQYFPTYVEEIKAYAPYYPEYGYFGSLTEHESCIYLTHPKCWNARSRLKTAREEGAGLGQTTRTFNPDGTIRFDTLTDLKNRYKTQLKDLNWDNIYDRADLQIRSIILLTGQNYRYFVDVPDPFQRMAFIDGSYNAGAGSIIKRRRLCGLQKGCDPNKWFDNVNTVNTTGNKAIYGTRTANDIVKNHVDVVMNVRLDKYVKAFKKYE